MITFSTNQTRLDVVFIHNFISKSYWAKGRTLEQMQTCINNSWNVGVYLNDTQIGYGRVVTDFFQFAYVMDVFIMPDERGKGYSKRLMEFMLNAPELKDINVWRLATHDAHDLYRQFGFTPLEKPENMMELIR